jgi:hypothetical protein
MPENDHTLPLTQRAYLLRLEGTKGDRSWHDLLWQTYEAVNRGVAAFGGWLLCFRAGLAPDLVESPVREGRGSSQRMPKDRERDRRIMLALSYLSVESRHGAPAVHVVSGPGESPTDALLARLEGTLRRRGVPEADLAAWRRDCRPSLEARIREDAVWVDRAAAFDVLAGEIGATTGDARAVIDELFAARGGALGMIAIDVDSEEASEAPQYSTVARGWLSNAWGAGIKGDPARTATNLDRLASLVVEVPRGASGGDFVRLLRTRVVPGTPGDDDEVDDLEALRQWAGWTTGRKSIGRLALEKVASTANVDDEAISSLRAKLESEARSKSKDASTNAPSPWKARLRTLVEERCGLPFRVERDLIGEYSVLLDHAARRVSQAHSWVQRNERERRTHEEDARLIEQVPAEARRLLDRFCAERSRASGALEEYRIRRGALGGRGEGAWRAVVGAWTPLTGATPEARKAKAREVQADFEDEKFGDIQLFEALAEDEYKAVWIHEGRPTAEPLVAYVLSRDAEAGERAERCPPTATPTLCAIPSSRSSASPASRSRSPPTSSARASSPPPKQRWRGERRPSRRRARWRRRLEGTPSARVERRRVRMPSASSTPPAERWRGSATLGACASASGPGSGCGVSTSDGARSVSRRTSPSTRRMTRVAAK